MHHQHKLFLHWYSIKIKYVLVILKENSATKKIKRDYKIDLPLVTFRLNACLVFLF